MLSGDRYHRQGTESVPAHGGTRDPGFDKGRTPKKRTALAGEWRQAQSAVYSDRLQLKNRHQGEHLSSWWRMDYVIAAYPEGIT